jgi:hypothetical protein
MPSADQVSVKSTHSKMRWPKWVVLIAGSTGIALRAVADHYLSSSVNAVNLKNRLSDVQSDSRDRLRG